MLSISDGKILLIKGALLEYIEPILSATPDTQRNFLFEKYISDHSISKLMNFVHSFLVYVNGFF